MFFHNYKQKIISVGRGNLIGYWPMDEHAGAVSADASPEGNNGAYTAVTLNNAVGPDGRGTPRFDGSTSFNDVYSVGLRDDFDGNSGSMLIWGKVISWVGPQRYLVGIGANLSNLVDIVKSNVANTLSIRRIGGGTTEINNIVTTTTDWFCAAITWDTVADEVKYYFNGALQATDNTIGNFVGVIPAGAAAIGSFTTAPFTVFNGWLAHCALWKTALSDTEIEILSKM